MERDKTEVSQTAYQLTCLSVEITDFKASVDGYQVFPNEYNH